MIDTLKTVVKIVEKASDNGIDLINKVDSFYNSAWEKLILVGSVAFAVIGILVPFIIQWYQKKSLKISEELMKKEMENQALKLKAELLEDIYKNIEEKVKVFEDKIEKLNASTNAKTFHLQGNGLLEKGNVNGALSDFITSAQDYLVCEDYSNLQTVLRLILNSCLPSVSVEEIDDLKISHNCDLESLINNLDKKDDNGIFSQTIRDIRLKVAKLPKTIKDKEGPKK